MLPTDTQKNTAFAYAKQHGDGPVEDYALALGHGCCTATPATSGAQVGVEEYAWDRVALGDREHDHTFVRRGREVRTVEVDVTAAGAVVHGGLTDLVLLKSTGSEFRGFLRDEYTTLPDADDRVLATSLRRAGAGTPRPARVGRALRATYATLLEAYAGTYSRALQETLYAMGRKVLERSPRSPRSASWPPTGTTTSSTSRRSGWRTAARCSSPPTAPTA